MLSFESFEYARCELAGIIGGGQYKRKQVMRQVPRNYVKLVQIKQEWNQSFHAKSQSLPTLLEVHAT